MSQELNIFIFTGYYFIFSCWDTPEHGLPRLQGKIFFGLLEEDFAEKKEKKFLEKEVDHNYPG